MSVSVSAVAAAVGGGYKEPLADGTTKRVRLAVVGDMHGQWTAADAAALRALQADAVLWVGECSSTSPA